MIPPFNDAGHLPPGIHRATLDQVDQRFGRASELRRVQMESVRWLVDLAGRAGVERIILNGSFTTDIIEPNDVDVVLLASLTLRSQAAEDELLEGLPFLDIKLVRPQEFDFYVDELFAFDRAGQAKGVIEVVP